MTLQVVVKPQEMPSGSLCCVAASSEYLLYCCFSCSPLCYLLACLTSRTLFPSVNSSFFDVLPVPKRSRGVLQSINLRLMGKSKTWLRYLNIYLVLIHLNFEVCRVTDGAEDSPVCKRMKVVAKLKLLAFILKWSEKYRREAKHFTEQELS